MGVGLIFTERSGIDRSFFKLYTVSGVAGVVASNGERRLVVPDLASSFCWQRVSSFRVGRPIVEKPSCKVRGPGHGTLIGLFDIRHEPPWSLCRTPYLWVGDSRKQLRLVPGMNVRRPCEASNAKPGRKLGYARELRWA
jgi:hypothetical protein